jgi:hypothetical protein
MNLSWIKKVYLYLVSLISLVILVIGGIMLINLGLKTWVFPKADDAYYYAPTVNCSAPPIAANGNASNYSQPAECNDPNTEKQMQEELVRRTAQKQATAAQAIAMILVATPVFYYHWKLARKEV